MNETNHIGSPADLYPLEIDKLIEEKQVQKLKAIQYDKEFESWANEFLNKDPG